MIKTRYFLFSVLIFFTAAIHAQVNLVPNPSFEADDHAPVITSFNWHSSANKDYLAYRWFQPTSGTPDMLNSDKSNLLGFKTKTARTGTGRMGLIAGVCKNGLVSWMMYQNTYSEYIECRLNQSLEAGKMYCVRYYVALDRKSNFASNNFGFAITTDSVSYPNSHTNMWGYDPYAHINQANNHYITSNEGWVMICDTFIAKGGEKFLTLGSFMDGFPKRIHQADKTQHAGLRVDPFNKFSYYYIDDVSLMEVKPDEVLCSPPRDSIARNNIAFMIDASGSMEQKGLIDAAKAAIIPLLNTLPPGDHVTLIAYSDVATVLADNITAGDTAQVRMALEKIKPGGGTNAVGGFNAAYGSIRKRMMTDGTNKIIVLTDGKVYLPKKEKEKIIAAANDEKIELSIIFFGEKVTKDMEKFAEDAGGHANVAKDGNPDEALRKEIPASIKDTPYGERNAGRIIAWEALTKILFPAILALVVMKALRVQV